MARDTSPTNRRGYERPALGDDWAGAWDELVEDQDEIAIARGPIADRPSTGTYDDEMYYAVDQRTLWRWDAAASDWEPAAGLGTASDPVPGTSHFESVSTATTIYDNGVIRTDRVDSGPAVLFDGQFVFGKAIVEKVSSGNAIGEFYLLGGADTVTKISDPQNAFGTAQGAADCNVYYDGSDYVLEITDGSFRAQIQYIGL